jgi:hypothetical protein
MSYGAIKKKPIVRIGRRQHSIIGLYSQNLLELLFKRGLSFYWLCLQTLKSLPLHQQRQLYKIRASECGIDLDAGAASGWGSLTNAVWRLKKILATERTSMTILRHK